MNRNLLSIESRLRLTAVLLKRTTETMERGHRGMFTGFMFGLADGLCFEAMTDGLERKVHNHKPLSRRAEKDLLIANRIWTHSLEKGIKKLRFTLPERAGAHWGRRVASYERTLARNENVTAAARNSSLVIEGISAD